MDNFDTYHVTNGCINGQFEEFAITSFGQKQKDGWYYIISGDDDGIGPFKTKDDAEEAADKALIELSKIDMMYDDSDSSIETSKESQIEKIYPDMLISDTVARVTEEKLNDWLNAGWKIFQVVPSKFSKPSIASYEVLEYQYILTK